jgi:hypothetical protein
MPEGNKLTQNTAIVNTVKIEFLKRYSISLRIYNKFAFELVMLLLSEIKQDRSCPFYFPGFFLFVCLLGVFGNTGV